ncbi:uncharacterized protein [Lepeophtheirus salmonis]|uniref:uncharacterized protein n=1 Tax=Lepeophtheirus salmonis TaxID=72036 RepID=UPI001AE57BCF|nr:uncharacterized protein LOC121122007 [Lepeophtheirus salmonis]
MAHGILFSGIIFICGTISTQVQSSYGVTLDQRFHPGPYVESHLRSLNELRNGDFLQKIFRRGRANSIYFRPEKQEPPRNKTRNQVSHLQAAPVYPPYDPFGTTEFIPLPPSNPSYALPITPNQNPHSQRLPTRAVTRHRIQNIEEFGFSMDSSEEFLNEDIDFTQLKRP